MRAYAQRTRGIRKIVRDETPVIGDAPANHGQRPVLARAGQPRSEGRSRRIAINVQILMLYVIDELNCIRQPVNGQPVA